jgi:chloramphenicol 3-O-phosphotransferase
MATIDEIATFVASACSLTVGTDLFKGMLPPEPDEAACVYEYPGSAPDYVMGSASIDQENPRVQIVFRGERDDYETPRDTAETAYRALAAVANQSLSSTRYLNIEPLQSPFALGPDGNGRHRIAFNCQITKAVSA